MVTAVEFRNGMRQLSGAVSILTTQRDGAPTGMTATAVCSLTADPPTLLVCVNREATSHQPIRSARCFAVNVLSAEDIETARRFSVGDMQSRFQVGRWSQLPSGTFALESSLVTFDCTLANEIPVGTHSVFIGQVDQVILRAHSVPLVYLNGQYAQIVPRDSG